MFITAYQLSRGAWFPKKNCFWKRLIFIKFGTGAIFFSNASRKFFLSSVKSAIYMFTETLWRKNVLFFNTNLFFSFRDSDRGIFGTFRQKKCQLCGKLHSTYPEDPFDENSSFLKLRIVQSVPDFEEKIPWFLFG